MYIGGLDVGTTGCKLTVYTDGGEYVFNSYREYEICRKDGEHEIDANVIFSAVCEVIKDSVSKYKVGAIGITTFGETFVALDENNNALLPSMLYTDPRGEDECKTLCEALGEEKLISIIGVKPHQMYSLPKLMWIKNNRPDVYKKIKRVLLMEDFIVYMLTHNAHIDYSLATRTMAFDIRKKCWSDEIFDAAGVDKNLFSTPVAPFNVAGNMRKEFCDKFGINYDIKICNGAQDQVAAAVGAGVFNAGDAVDGTGTVECITPVFDSVPTQKDLYDKGYCVVPFVFEDTYVSYAVSFAGGASIKWFRDNFAKDISYKDLDGAVKDKPTGILVMPHFVGAGTPYMDNDSKAAFVGVTFEHTHADFYKAIMEGVTYEIMINVKNLKNYGIDPERLYATGGGANSDIWLQIKADILNKPITTLQSKEVGACGTCMMVGVAIGLYKDLYEAKEKFVKEKKTYMPNPENTKLYSKYFESYQKLYDAVNHISHEL